MNIVYRSVSTVLVVFFLLGATKAQTQPVNNQTPTPIITATASSNRVRYVTIGEVNHTRLQVFSAVGVQVFDSGFKLGNDIDWGLVDQQGTTLTDGSYLFLVTVKDFSNGLTQKYGTAILEQGQIYLEQTTRSELTGALSSALESNQQAETLSSIDRIGAAGLNRTASTAGTSGTASTSGTTETDATGGDKDIGGAGTQNQLAKWIDNAGNLGDSIITESGGSIGIGTPSPGQKLHVATGNLQIGSGTNSHSLLLNYTGVGGGGDITAMMNGVEMLSFGFNNTGQLGGTPGTASGRILYFYDRQAAAYRGGFNSSGEWYWGPTASNYGLKVAQPNVGVTGVAVDASGNVGIGTNIPGARLHVLGNVNFTGLRTEGGPNPNVIGGHRDNAVVAGVFGATISGGGIGDEANHVTDLYGTVGGGINNIAGNGGSDVNDSAWATVGGGGGNFATGNRSTVGGGNSNTASGGSSTVSGGFRNIAGGLSSTVGGGFSNTASGELSTVPGGNFNIAQGSHSFATGFRAYALHQGSFVWSDFTTVPPNYFTSTADNQFLINATGGVGIGTNSPSFKLHVTDTSSAGLRVETLTTGGAVASFGGFGDFQVDANGIVGGRFIVKEGGNVGIGRNDPLYKLHVNGTVAGTGPYVDASDLRYKRDIHTIGGALSKVLSLRGVTFDWRREEFPALDFASGRNVGFVAQEVERVVPEAVVRDAAGFRSVAYSHLTPLLVEAVKEQQQQLQAKDVRIADLEARLARTESRLAWLAQDVERVRRRGQRRRVRRGVR